MVDTPDLKSCELQGSYGFDSRPGYKPSLHSVERVFVFLVNAGKISSVLENSS